MRCQVVPLVAVLLLSILPAIAAGQMPAHLVLARSQASSYHTPYSPAQKVSAQPYPYGYFGARPTTHWQRQFGAYRMYTQWSQK